MMLFQIVAQHIALIIIITSLFATPASCKPQQYRLLSWMTESMDHARRDLKGSSGGRSSGGGFGSTSGGGLFGSYRSYSSRDSANNGCVPKTEMVYDDYYGETMSQEIEGEYDCTAKETLETLFLVLVGSVCACCIIIGLGYCIYANRGNWRNTCCCCCKKKNKSYKHHPSGQE